VNLCSPRVEEVKKSTCHSVDSQCFHYLLSNTFSFEEDNLGSGLNEDHYEAISKPLSFRKEDIKGILSL